MAGPGDNPNDQKKDVPKHAPSVDFDAAMGRNDKANGPNGPQQPAKSAEAPPAAAPATPKAGSGFGAPEKPATAATPEAAKPATEAKPEAKPATEAKPEAKPATEAKPEAKPEAAKAADAPKPEDIVKNVNRILDTEVAQAIKAGQADKAEEGYKRAIAEANKISQADIDKAKTELAEVRKQKLVESNPEKKRQLAEREADLYTMSRIKDSAYGNEALFFYRQGKVQEGNAKLLEAAGVDPETAKLRAKMTPEDLKALNEKVPDVTKVTIFDDIYFQRQMARLRDEKGIAVPDAYFAIHNLAHKTNVEAETKVFQQILSGQPATPGAPGAPAEVAKPGSPAATGTPSEVVKPGSPEAAKPDAPKITSFDENAAKPIEAAGRAAIEAASKPDAKITDEQRKAIEAEIEVKKQREGFLLNEAETARQALLAKIPVDKQQAFVDAADKYRDSLSKIPPTAANDLATRMDAAFDQDPAHKAAKEAAVAGLNKDYPGLIDSQTALLGVLNDPAKTQDAFSSYSVALDLNKKASDAQDSRTAEQLAYSEILLRNGDKAKATESFQNAFKNIPDWKKAEMLGTDGSDNEMTRANKKLAADLGFDGKPDVPGAPAEAGKVTEIDPKKPIAEQVRNLSTDTLIKLKDQVQGEGSESFYKGKAVYEELIRRADRAEDPQFFDKVRADIQTCQKQLEEKKDLTPEEKFQLHTDINSRVGMLAEPSLMRYAYARYLADMPLREQMVDDANAAQGKDFKPGSIAKTTREVLPGGVNQLASMQKTAEEAFHKADEMAQKNKDLFDKEGTLLDRDLTGVPRDQVAMMSEYKKDIYGGSRTITVDGGQQVEVPVRGVAELPEKLRSEMALFYLARNAANGMEAAHGSPVTAAQTALYKPQEAVRLVTEAAKAHQFMHPGSAEPPDLTRVKQFGLQNSPEYFKGLADENRSMSASSKADMVAMLAAVGGQYAGPALAAALHIKLPPAVSADIGALGFGVAGRSLAYRYFDGSWENAQTSLVHGAASAAIPIVFKHTTSFLSGESQIAAGLSRNANNLIGGYRTAAITDAQVAQRIVGEGGTGAKFLQEVELKGYVNRDALNTLRTENPSLLAKPVAKMTEDEVKQLYGAVKPELRTGTQRAEFLGTLLKGRPDSEAMIQALREQNIKTVGAMDKAIAEQNAHVEKLMNGLEQTSLANQKRFGTASVDALVGRNPNMSIKDVVSQIARENPNSGLKSAADIDREVATLQRAGINTLGDARVAYINANRGTIDNFMQQADAAGLTGPRNMLGRARDTISNTQSLKNMVAELKSKGTDVSEIEKRLPLLSRMGVNELSDLRAANSLAAEQKSLETFRERYKGLTGIDEKTPLAKLGRQMARPLDAEGSAAWRTANAIAGGEVPTVARGGILGTAESAARWTYKTAWADRFYNVPDAVKAYRNGSSANWGRLGADFASGEQLMNAANQTRRAATMLGVGAGSMVYRGSTAVYDNVYSTTVDGRTRKWVDAKGDVHEYSIGDALKEAYTGRETDPTWARVLTSPLADVLLGGFVLQGAVPSALRLAAPEAANTAGRGLRAQLMAKGAQAYRSEAVSNNAMPWILYGMQGGAQGVLGDKSTTEFQEMHDAMVKPLQDAPIEDTGSIAEAIRAKQAQSPAPAAEAPKAEAPVTPTPEAPAKPEAEAPVQPTPAAAKPLPPKPLPPKPTAQSTQPAPAAVPASPPIKKADDYADLAPGG